VPVELEHDKFEIAAGTLDGTVGITGIPYKVVVPGYGPVVDLANQPCAR
jgi:hypothetical protein